MRWFLILLLAVGLVACGSGGDDDLTKPVKRAERRAKKAQAEEEEETPTKIVSGKRLIKSVTISPEVVTAGDKFSVSVDTYSPLGENQQILFQYRKDGEIIEESRETSLDPKYYSKRDVLSVDVLVMEDGEMIDMKRSRRYPVLNSPPVIEDVQMPDIKGPGTYKFIVEATDADEDELSYSVEEDLPFDFSIDQASAEISCTLGEDAPENFEFTVTVSDDDGDSVSKIVSLKFFKRPVKE